MTTWTPLPSSALRYAGSVATSVLPSPVFISAIVPRCSTIAADQLHVEVPHVEHAAAGFADDGKGLGQQVVERLAVGDARLEFGGLRAQRSSDSGWIGARAR